MVRAARRSLAICCLAFSLINLWMASLSWGLAFTIGGEEDEMASRLALDAAWSSIATSEEKENCFKINQQVIGILDMAPLP